MSVACKQETQKANTAINMAKSNYINEAKFKLNEMIGYPDQVKEQLSENTKLNKLALKSYNRIRNLILDQLDSIGLKNNYNPKYVHMKMAQWFDYFQKQYGTPYLVIDKASGKVDPHRLISAAKLVAKAINLQQTKFGKGKIPEFEREMMPVKFFTMRHDVSGEIHDFINHATSMIEESRRKSAPFKAAFHDVYSKTDAALDNILSRMGNIYGYDVTMVSPKMNTDDIIDDSIGIDNMVTTGNDPVIFLGTVKENGELYHDVIFKKTEERKLIPYNEISIDEIRDGIKRKYGVELVNELMEGQTRYVEWADEPTDEDLKEIQKILTKWQLTNKVRKSLGEKLKTIRDVHFATIKGHKIAFVMIKHPIEVRNGKVQEVYKAYIISHEIDSKIINYFESKNKNKRLPIETLGLKNGFYRATKWYNHGVNYTMESEKGWYFGSNALNSYMKVQPNEVLLYAPEMPSKVSRLGADKRLEYSSIFTTVQKLRGLYDEIGGVFKQMATEQEKYFNEWFGNNSEKLLKVLNRFPELRGKKKQLDIHEALDMLKEIFLIDASVYVDNDGNVHTNSSFFDKIGDNYITRSYRPEDLDHMLNIEIKNLISDIHNLQNKPNKTNIEDMYLSKLKKNLQSLELSQIIATKAWKFNEDILQSYGIDSPSGIKIYQKNIYAKTRSQWTDPTMRIKDEPNYRQYLDDVFYGFEKNSLMFKALGLIDTLSRHEANQMSTIEYIVNRAMASTSSDKVKGRLFGIDISYQGVANTLNRLKIFGTHYEAEDIERMTRMSTSTISGAILGTYSTMGNLTQNIDTIGYYGYHTWNKARKMLNDENPVNRARVNAILENTGALESLLMFTDVIADATNLRAKDDMLMIDARFMGVPIPIPRPRYLLDVLRLSKSNKKKFIENGIPEVDKFLTATEMGRVEKNKNILKRIEDLKQHFNGRKGYLKTLEREEKRLHGELDKRDIRYLRELYLKLILTPRDEKNYAILQARFQDLVGKVHSNRLKRILGWKLGKSPLPWYKSTEKLLTMTGSEEEMTRTTILAALLTADEVGALGSSRKLTVAKHADGTEIVDDNGNPVHVYERFLSPIAVRIARNAVDNIMFRMSPQHLGDAFLGAGKGAMLYKGYQFNQMIYDYQAMRNLFNSSTDPAEVLKRISKALFHVMTVKNLEMNDPKLDITAVRAARSLLLRGGLTALSVGMESIPFLKFLTYYNPSFKIFGISARGGENPFFSMPIRLLLNSMIWAAAGDDYDPLKHDLGVMDIFRLFMPVMLTLPIMSAIKTYQYFIK